VATRSLQRIAAVAKWCVVEGIWIVLPLHFLKMSVKRYEGKKRM